MSAKNGSQKLLDRLKHTDATKVCIFSDEKIFTTNAAVNRRNSRYLTNRLVENVDQDVRVSPFAKALQKIIQFNSIQKNFIWYDNCLEHKHADIYLVFLAIQ